MKTGYEVKGAEALIRRLKEHPAAIARAADSVLKQEARALCVAYGAKTEPYGMQEASGDKFRKLVDGDVRAVFASRQNPAAVYRLLLARRPDLAKAYWHAYKSEKPRRMGQILTQAGLPEGINPAALKAARTGPGKRVKRKGLTPASIAPESQVRAFSKKQQLLVGMAKAGWYAAARALGGRVRSNKTDAATGKRSTAEIFPPFVRKLARKFPQAGGARWKPGEVEVFTRVKHADRALSDQNYWAAMKEAQASLAKSLAAAVREVNRRFGKAA